jgi:hypothetical protein
MRKTSLPPPTGRRPNPVAKHAHKVNRAVVFLDRSRSTRKSKHKAREPFPLCGVNHPRTAEKVRVH